MGSEAIELPFWKVYALNYSKQLQARFLIESEILLHTYTCMD